jgi:K+-transporting ATPase c subunit
MITLDFVDVLAGYIPREIGTFIIKEIVPVDKQSWRLRFFDPRIVKTGTKEVADFGMFVELGATEDCSKYALRFQGRTKTSVPVRALEWAKERAIALDTTISTSGVHNRITVEEANKYLNFISSSRIIMDAKHAELLACKDSQRLKEFLPSFDAVFFQLAVDSINLIHMNQWYQDYVKGLSS